jgi:hypothetical protein
VHPGIGVHLREEVLVFLTHTKPLGMVVHIPSDFVVDPWASDVESRSHLDCRFLHLVETTCGCRMSAKITPAISMA